MPRPPYVGYACMHSPNVENLSLFRYLNMIVSDSLPNNLKYIATIYTDIGQKASILSPSFLQAYQRIGLIADYGLHPNQIYKRSCLTQKDSPELSDTRFVHAQ